jgi:hypothetical protein
MIASRSITTKNKAKLFAFINQAFSNNDPFFPSGNDKLFQKGGNVK